MLLVTVFALASSPPLAKTNSVAAGAPSAGGEYTSLTPARIVDTRVGLGTGVIAPVGPDSSIDIQVTGKGGIPTDGVRAVVIRLTADRVTSFNTWLAVFPTGLPRPAVSNLNPRPDNPRANLVTVGVGVGGEISIYNKAGDTDVIVDVVGFYADDDGPEGSRFRTIAGVRIGDTRHGIGGIGATKFGPLETRTIGATGIGGVPASGATEVVLNVTTTNSTDVSYLTVYPADVARPGTSDSNWGPFDTIAGQVIVRVPADGMISLFNFAGQTDVIVDLVGYYEDAGSEAAGRFVEIDPFRAFDTRITSPFPPPGHLTPGDVLVYGSTTETYSAFVLNLTTAGSVLSGFVVAYPHPGDAPAISTINYGGGDAALHAIVGNGPQMAFRNEVHATHLTGDIFGAFT